MPPRVVPYYATLNAEVLNGIMTPSTSCKTLVPYKEGETCIKEYLHSIESLQFAISCGYQVDHHTRLLACELGNLPVVQWITEHHVEMTDHGLFINAIAHGHVHIMDWFWNIYYFLLEGLPYYCTLAARRGHLEALQWLHEHRYPWNYKTVLRCASGLPVQKEREEMVAYLLACGK
jgi:hypothetical protein